MVKTRLIRSVVKLSSIISPGIADFIYHVKMKARGCPEQLPDFAVSGDISALHSQRCEY